MGRTACVKAAYVYAGHVILTHATGYREIGFVFLAASSGIGFELWYRNHVDPRSDLASLMMSGLHSVKMAGARLSLPAPNGWKINDSSMLCALKYNYRMKFGWVEPVLVLYCRLLSSPLQLIERRAKNRLRYLSLHFSARCCRGASLRYVDFAGIDGSVLGLGDLAIRLLWLYFALHFGYRQKEFTLLTLSRDFLMLTWRVIATAHYF